MSRLIAMLAILCPFTLMADPAANKEAIQNFYKGIVEQKYKTIDSLLADKYQLIIMGEKPEPTADINKRTRQWHKAFPGFTVKIEDMVAEGDKVVVRIKMQGLQKGPFMGVTPTGKNIVMRSFAEFTLANGRINRIIENWDELTIMKQLGAIVLN